MGEGSEGERKKQLLSGEGIGAWRRVVMCLEQGYREYNITRSDTDTRTFLICAGKEGADKSRVSCRVKVTHR